MVPQPICDLSPPGRVTYYVPGPEDRDRVCSGEEVCFPAGRAGAVDGKPPALCPLGRRASLVGVLFQITDS